MVPTAPTQLPGNEFFISGIPMLDEDFDPSDPLMPENIDMSYTQEDWDE